MIIPNSNGKIKMFQTTNQECWLRPLHRSLLFDTHHPSWSPKGSPTPAASQVQHLHKKKQLAAWLIDIDCKLLGWIMINWYQLNQPSYSTNHPKYKREKKEERDETMNIYWNILEPPNSVIVFWKVLSLLACLTLDSVSMGSLTCQISGSPPCPGIGTHRPLFT